jgi:hypothetical protein
VWHVAFVASRHLLRPSGRSEIGAASTGSINESLENRDDENEGSGIR